ncbi:MAG: hypothetical protein ACP5MZ_03665, partial [Candidatus Micrarchaeia archaeon]
MQKQKTSNIDSITLENGLTIYAAKAEGFTGAAIAARVNFGTSDEKSNGYSRGSAHLLEHVVLDGIGKKKELGYLAANTRYEYTLYKEMMHIDNIQIGIDAIREMLLRPDINESAYLKAKKEVVQEVSRGAVKGFYSLTYMPFALYG